MRKPFKMKMKSYGKGKNPIMKKSKEGTTAQKLAAVKGYKKHGGKPGYQEYVDKIFGGPTKVEGMKTTTTTKKK